MTNLENELHTYDSILPYMNVHACTFSKFMHVHVSPFFKVLPIAYGKQVFCQSSTLLTELQEDGKECTSERSREAKMFLSSIDCMCTCSYMKVNGVGC